MMTIEEAIAHCYEKANSCDACGREHLQLAHWLEELVELRQMKMEREKDDIRTSRN